MTKMDLGALSSLAALLLVGLCCAGKDVEHGADDDTDITSIILRMNNGSDEFLLEGDMMVPKTRNAQKCLNKQYSCLWEKSANGLVEVPFLISDKYDVTEKSTILGAMKGFGERTCIRFVPRRRQRAYLTIEPRNGCFSLLGRIGDKQMVSLQRFGCVHHGIIQHELLHALGFYHEHTRSDRDNYIKINWENLKNFFLINFEKKDSNNLNTKYDYTSVMHYGRTAFGTNRKVTIVPIPDASAPIGQRENMSELDLLRINKLYKC
ncbi:low choriolytic enzyme-like [Pseudoliparis swirei]|uniref:low choriolytic enzyme-like n=1 Tax=Pseudoliparis swirei TaxID=2059687 RepID=UPI0024BE3E74|nr:low choriolytic enzyme-like [Pseudoliparis swirei]